MFCKEPADDKAKVMAFTAWWLGPQELKQKPPTEGLLVVLLVVVKYCQDKSSKSWIPPVNVTEQLNLTFLPVK